MPRLNKVFGLSTEVPEYTYVDRNDLDSQFCYYLDADRHVVVYGGSKQGKTILRKKNLSHNQEIVVNCRQGLAIEQIYLNILQQLGTKVDKQVTTSLTQAGKLALDAEGEAGIPLLAKGKAKGSLEGSLEHSRETASEALGIDPQHLEYIAGQIRNSKKRVVLEDFHYLSEQQQRRLAFDLKGFWDNNVFFIIVGIWEEHNLLTYYNGDLSGRVEEIDVEWTNSELEQVLDLGCDALNIRFSNPIGAALVTDSNGNVGLLQQLAEKLCIEERIHQSSRSVGKRTVTSVDSLEATRRKLCSDLGSRYRNFFEIMEQGFENTGHEPYRDIVHTCAAEFEDAQLTNGLHHSELLSAINKFDGPIKSDELFDALGSLNRLQAQKQVYPMVLYYNADLQKLQLADREFLFYRRYCNVRLA